MNSWAQGEGQPGLGYIFWREGEEGGAGPLAKNIGPERTKQIADQLGLGVGDACFFVAGKPKDFYKFAGSARTKVGEELKLIAQDVGYGSEAALSRAFKAQSGKSPREWRKESSPAASSVG
jgi:aspartyl-tRNA synthetase